MPQREEQGTRHSFRSNILACSHLIAKCSIYRIGSPRRRDVLVCCHLDEHLTEAHRASRPPGAAKNTRRTGAEEFSLFPAADMHQTAYQGDHRTRLMKIMARKKVRQQGKRKGQRDYRAGRLQKRVSQKSASHSGPQQPGNFGFDRIGPHKVTWKADFEQRNGNTRR